jgi:adenylate cyclase
MASEADSSTASDQTAAIWRAILTGTDDRYAKTRRLLRRVPSAPRCKMCAAPFGGLGAPIMRVVGRAPWEKNHHYCGVCFTVLQNLKGGAEIECSLLFADVRGSTRLAEQMSPSKFRQLMARFYELAAGVLVERDAIVDKFVGDEVVAIFIPALAGDAHAGRAIASAQALLDATGNTGGGQPWLPLGAGVHTGIAFVGSVGQGVAADLTALGDVVNVAARLASAAAAGEILCTTAAARAAVLPTEKLELRRLNLRGKSEATEVVVVSGELQSTGPGGAVGN